MRSLFNSILPIILSTPFAVGQLKPTDTIPADKLGEEFSDLDYLNLNATTLETNKIFDGIYSNKVLHHLKDAALRTSIKN